MARTARLLRFQSSDCNRAQSVVLGPAPCSHEDWFHVFLACRPILRSTFAHTYVTSSVNNVQRSGVQRAAVLGILMGVMHPLKVLVLCVSIERQLWGGESARG